MHCCKSPLMAIWLSLLTSFYASHFAYAQEKQSIRIELNKVSQNASSCLMAFVVTNNTATDIGKLAFEVVVFNKEDQIDRMTIFDFKDAAAGKQRVRQFQLQDTSCQSLGMLLINDVADCEAPEVQSDFCGSKLKLSNRSTIKFVN